MTKEIKIKAECLDCKRETNHIVIATKLVDNRTYDDYYEGKEYSIIRCLGCDEFSFLKTYHDYETRYDIDWDGNYEYSKTYTNFYPDASETLYRYRSLLPQKLYIIYEETKIAFTQNLNIFTAIGIRSMIECICNNKEVKGSNLEKKISNLKNIGDISKRDVDLLHSLRFLGNDAVHEVIKPSREDIKVAFSIIEHLIQAIYIMSRDLKGTSLKSNLDEYDKFERFLLDRAKDEVLNSDISHSLKKLIGALGKVPHEKFTEFQEKLNTKIRSGELDWIEIAVDTNQTQPNADESGNSNEVFYKILKKPQ